MKHQIPTSKLQRSSKHTSFKHLHSVRDGGWLLELGISLVLGVWCLVLSPDESVCDEAPKPYGTSSDNTQRSEMRRFAFDELATAEFADEFAVAGRDFAANRDNMWAALNLEALK
jgi:hypothetical protein